MGLTMTDEQEHRDRNMADSFPHNDQRARAWAEIDATRARLAEVERALRHLSATADTLSPQEFINVCADALGVDRHEYAGASGPHHSIVELTRERDEALRGSSNWRENWIVATKTLAALAAECAELRTALAEEHTGGAPCFVDCPSCELVSLPPGTTEALRAWGEKVAMAGIMDGLCHDYSDNEAQRAAARIVARLLPPTGDEATP